MSLAIEPMSSHTAEIIAAANDNFVAGHMSEAERLCRQVLRDREASPWAFHLLGQISLAAHNFTVAEAMVRQAMRLAPNEPAFHDTKGVLELYRPNVDAATRHFERSIELNPEFAPALLNLALVHAENGTHGLAEHFRARAVNSDPEAIRQHVRLHFRLNVALMYSCQLNVAVSRMGYLRDLQPDFVSLHSSLIFALHYLPECDHHELFLEAKSWGEKFAVPLAPVSPSFHGSPEPDRRLRIGYVSGDFRRHPVGIFLEEVLRHHDHSAFEVICYSNHDDHDDLTERLQGFADQWHVVFGMSDAQLADRIRGDAVDILVDLSGHTAYNRLLAFARKPAPVQVSWIGYFDTTGIPAIDYVLADSFVCPEGCEQFYIEKLARLPGSYLCFSPIADNEVRPPPFLNRGFVTFGCYNRIIKLSPSLVATWSEILKAIPTARLCLKDLVLANPIVRRRVASWFEMHDIDADRLTFLGNTKYEDYLDAYGEIDIALDPFPFNGGTTTVEALWMGVPVISLAGDRFVSRMGVSHLNAVGLSDLIASSPDDYVRRAVTLANDRHRLTELRARLRGRMQRSSLRDGPGFTSEVEETYRQMWRTYCESTMVKDEEISPKSRRSEPGLKLGLNDQPNNDRT